MGRSGCERDATQAGPWPKYSLYKELSAEPIAAASIGQVYAGRVARWKQGGGEGAATGDGEEDRVATCTSFASGSVGWRNPELNGSEDLPTRLSIK